MDVIVAEVAPEGSITIVTAHKVVSLSGGLAFAARGAGWVFHNGIFGFCWDLVTVGRIRFGIFSLANPSRETERVQVAHIHRHTYLLSVVRRRDAREIAVAVTVVLDFEAKMLNGSVNGSFCHNGF